MPKVLNLDEMLAITQSLELPDAGHYQNLMEAVGNMMATAIAERLTLDVGPAEAQGPEFGGTCASFYPVNDDDEMPEALSYYDDQGGDDSEWMTRETMTAYMDASCNKRLCVHHDMHGFYILTQEEAAHEAGGNPSVGFDGRPHYATIAEAWREAAEMPGNPEPSEPNADDALAVGWHKNGGNWRRPDASKPDGYTYAPDATMASYATARDAGWLWDIEGKCYWKKNPEGGRFTVPTAAAALAHDAEKGGPRMGDE